MSAATRRRARSVLGRGQQPGTTMPATTVNGRQAALACDADVDLTFDGRGGPLLAVCGLCGGAGASTLAYLVALAAARSSSAPVLVCDTGTATAGLALYADTTSPRSLAEAADKLARNEPLTGGLSATAKSGLQVIAGAPNLELDGDLEGVARVLDDARAAHALTVVDCGTLARAAERLALEMASHITWMLPATVGGVARAQMVLDAVRPYLPGREALVARNDSSGRKAPLGELQALAQERCAPLVLMPHISDIAESDPSEAIKAAQVTLQALATVTRR